jgi:predicted transcriptional regulator
MKKPRFFSPAEWELLQHLMERPPMSVREVTADFADTHGYARTTVLTMLERLREKGYLTRRKIDGVHHYSPREPRSDLLQGLVRDFVQKALGGSVSPFVAYLGKEARLSARERQELKQLIEEWEAEDEAGDGSTN